MNLDKLKEKLIAAARTQPVDDRVPYAFEKRITARLAKEPVDIVGLWARALWRATVPCVGVTLLLGVFTLLPMNQETNDEELSATYESMMMATDYQSEEL